MLTVANIAGIQAAKQTATLIPLCHQVPLDKVELSFTFSDDVIISENSRDDVIFPEDATREGIDPSPTKIDTELTAARRCLTIFCTCKCSSRTGVEMEALVGVSVAALTVYDMCKAVDKAAVITGTRLVKKSGGKSGEFYKPWV